MSALKRYGVTTAEALENMEALAVLARVAAHQFRLDHGLSDPNPMPVVRLWGRR